MGTRSRILLRRSTKPDIHLWMHYDGYLSGVGKILCNQLLLLLSKYTPIDLSNMVEALDVRDLKEGVYQNFDIRQFAAFMEGSTHFKNDDCSDFEYEYSVDFSKQTLVISLDGNKATVTFDMLLKRFDIESLEDKLNGE